MKGQRFVSSGYRILRSEDVSKDNRRLKSVHVKFDLPPAGYGTDTYLTQKNIARYMLGVEGQDGVEVLAFVEDFETEEGTLASTYRECRDGLQWDSSPLPPPTSWSEYHRE